VIAAQLQEEADDNQPTEFKHLSLKIKPAWQHEADGRGKIFPGF